MVIASAKLPVKLAAIVTIESISIEVISSEAVLVESIFAKAVFVIPVCHLRDDSSLI